MAKFPYLTQRNGTRNLLYKRRVPDDLRADGRPQQIWRSLNTSDLKMAKKLYATEHARVEALFEQWRQELTPALSSVAQASKATLTAALIKRVTQTWKSKLIEQDFRNRRELWAKATADPEGLIQGIIIPYKPRDPDPIERIIDNPETDLQTIFTGSIRLQYSDRRLDLRDRYMRGDVAYEEGELERLSISLAPADLTALARQCLTAEIEVIEDLIKGTPIGTSVIAEDEISNSTLMTQTQSTGLLMSTLLDRYIVEESKVQDWCLKDTNRWRSILLEWLEIVGDRPINNYTAAHGSDFRSVQISLPRRRQVGPFRGKKLRDCTKLADKSDPDRKDIPRISSLTLRDKIGCVRRFFEWTATHDASVVNPVASIKIAQPKKRNRIKTRLPWAVDELNQMLASPLFSGCKSRRRWKEPGEYCMTDTAEYWVPLIGLYSGMRLGEIIQLHTADIRAEGAVLYFDVTVDAAAPTPNDAQKSLKTASSRRHVPIHKQLLELGLMDHVNMRRKQQSVRLFPEYSRADNDGSWSKQFTKHFARFRATLELREGVDFHSLRHNFEDALRNAAQAPEDIRDAIMGHSSSKSVGRQYGDGFTLVTLHQFVERVRYNGLALHSEHLKTS